MVFWLSRILLVLATPCHDKYVGRKKDAEAIWWGSPLDDGGLVCALCLIVEEGCMLDGNGYPGSSFGGLKNLLR